jgi:hypothetical protein
MRRRLQALAVRVAIATLIAWILATMPLPQLAPQTIVAFIQVPIIIFGLICYIGKLIIDTFFYDHYQP